MIARLASAAYLGDIDTIWQEPPERQVDLMGLWIAEHVTAAGAKEATGPDRGQQTGIAAMRALARQQGAL